MSLTIKDQIICLLKENHSNWDDSIDFNDHATIIPMLESFYQHDLIHQYIELLEADEPKLDTDQKLDAAGLKMARQKLSRNQHQLPADKIRQLDRSLEKLQKAESMLLADIKSKEALLKGASVEDQANGFDEIVKLRSSLKDIRDSIADKQGEKSKLSSNIDVAGDEDNFPDYQRTNLGAGRQVASDDDLLSAKGSLEELKARREKIEDQKEKLKQLLFASPSAIKVKNKLAELNSLKSVLRANQHKLSQQTSIADSLGQAEFKYSDEEKQIAKAKANGLTGHISQITLDINKLTGEIETIKASLDPNTRSLIDSSMKIADMLTKVDAAIEHKEGLVNLDKKGEKVASEPVKVVGKDPLKPESALTRFKTKLEELTNNFNSILSNAKSASEKGTSSFGTLGQELMFQVRAFYGDHANSNAIAADGGAAASFKSNSRIGTGRDLSKQIQSFVENDLTGTDVTTATIKNAFTGLKFSSQSMSASEAFKTDLAALNLFFMKLKRASETNGSGVRLGTAFVKYIDESLEKFKEFGRVSDTLGKLVSKQLDLSGDDLDVAPIHDDLKTYNSNALRLMMKYVTTLDAIPEIANNSRLLHSYQFAIEKIAQSKTVEESVKMIKNLLDTIAKVAPKLGSDEKVKEVYSRIKAVHTNILIDDLVSNLKRVDAGYVYQDKYFISVNAVRQVVSQNRNGQSTFDTFVQELLGRASKYNSSDKEVTNDEPKKSNPIIRFKNLKK